MPSQRSPTIIVLYDDDCPLRSRLLTIKASDQRNQIRLINIRDEQFSAHAWGFAPEALETALHVRDLAGHWHMAMDAVRLLYRAVGLTAPLAHTLNQADLPDLRVDFDRLYTNNTYRANLSGEVDLPPLVKTTRSKIFDSLLIGRCSNDDCFLAEVIDTNSRA